MSGATDHETAVSEELGRITGACLARLGDNMSSADFQACAIAETAKQPDATCRLHAVLVTQEGCPYCKEMKAVLESELASGLVREVEDVSDEGQRLLTEADQRFVPALFLVDSEGAVVTDLALIETEKE